MPSVFDRAHFDHMTGADAALQAEILALFRGQAEAWSGALAPERGPASWREAAHTMKGSARGLGLWALAEAADGAETLAREGAEGAAMDAALARLRAALAEALCAIERAP